MENIVGEEQAVSAEFLQNVQSAVNSTGVLGRVGVIDTENGPMTVIFMDDAVDNTASSLTMADDSNLAFQGSGTDEVQYQFQIVDNGNSFCDALGNSQPVASEPVMDNIVEEPPITDLEITQPMAQIVSSNYVTVAQDICENHSTEPVTMDTIGNVTTAEFTATKLPDSSVFTRPNYTTLPSKVITIEKPYVVKKPVPVQQKLVTLQKIPSVNSQFRSLKQNVTATLIPAKSKVSANKLSSVSRQTATVNSVVSRKPQVITLPKSKVSTVVKQQLQKSTYVSVSQAPYETIKIADNEIVPGEEMPEISKVSDQVDITKVAMQSILDYDYLAVQAKHMHATREYEINEKDALNVNASTQNSAVRDTAKSVAIGVSKGDEYVRFVKNIESNGCYESSASQLRGNNKEIICKDINKTIKSVECDECDKTFVNNGDLQKHKKTAHVGLLMCSTSKPSFDKSDDYSTNKKKSAQDQHKCDVCFDEFSSIVLLKEHERVTHGVVVTDIANKMYLCELCGRSFNTRSNYKSHIRVHEGYKPYRCQKCNTGFSKKYSLERHLPRCGSKAEIKRIAERTKLRALGMVHDRPKKLKSSTSGAHKCDHCGRHFQANFALTKHKRVIHGIFKNKIKKRPRENGYEILLLSKISEEECKTLSFKRNDNWNVNHIVHLHDEGQINIEKSLKKDKNDSNRLEDVVDSLQTLRNETDRGAETVTEIDDGNEKAVEHAEKETGVENDEKDVDKVYRCKFCKQCFRDLQDVKTHVQVHKLICKECSKQFKNSMSLKRHMLVSHSDIGVELFTCSKCFKVFTCESNLLSHMTTHIGPWICSFPECEAQFTERKDLTIHRQSHSKGQFECSCQMKFCRKTNLLRHYGRGLCPISDSLDAIIQGSFKLEHEDRVKSRQLAKTKSKVNVPFAMVENYIEKSTGFTETPHGRVQAPVKCRICFQQFKDHTMAKKHIIMRHSHNEEEKQYKCETCDFATHFQYVFKKHLMVHNRPFPCQLCKRSFETKIKLDGHVSMHYKDKYQCYYCAKQYLSKKSCKDHIMIVHSETQNEKEAATENDVPGVFHADIPTTAVDREMLPSTADVTCGKLPEDIFQESDEPIPMEDNGSDFGGVAGDILLSLTAANFKDSNEAVSQVKTSESNVEQQSEKIKLSEADGTRTATNIQSPPIKTVYQPMSPVRSVNDGNQSPGAVGRIETTQKQVTVTSESPGLPYNPEHDKLLVPDDNDDIHKDIQSNRSLQSYDKAPTGLEQYEPLRKNYKCAICAEEFQHEKSFRAHFITNYTENTYCNVCKEDLGTKFRLNNHLFKHGVGTPLECPKCGAGFQKAEKYWIHAQKHAGLFTCNICKKSFNQKGDLTQHMEIHSERNFICVMCGEIFNQRLLLKYHKQEVHSIRSYVRKTDHVQVDKEKQYENDSSKSEDEDYVTIIENITGNGKQEAILSVKSKVGNKEQPVVEMYNYVDSHGQLVKGSVPTVCVSPSKCVPQPLPEETAPQEMQVIQVPDSDVTIQVYGDGTLVTSDKSGTNYSNINLDSLNLDPAMLQGETNIELVIVQGDGKEVRASIKTNLPNIAQEPSDQTAKEDMCNVQQSNMSTQTSHMQQKQTVDNSEITQKNKEPRPYKCSMCPRTFKFYRTFRCHEVVHNKKETYSCSICKRVFAREVNLRSHLRLHEEKSSRKLFDRGEIKTGAKRTKRTKEEVEKMRNISEWKCTRCDKVFSTIYQLTKHEKYVHDRINETACPICKKVFNSESAVQRHLKSHVGPFKCLFCALVFKLREELSEHLKSQHPERSYTCTICNSILHTKKFYWAHIRRVHWDKPEEKSMLSSRFKLHCNVCGKVFNKRSALTRHHLVHSGEKKFTCPYCPAKFNLNWKLNKHKSKKHAQNLQFRCDSCNLGFKTKMGLDKHTKVLHNGAYKCTKCGETFKDRLEYKLLHGNVHETIDHKCEICLERFKTKKALVRHIRAEHTRPKTCLCDICGMGFCSNGYLKYHLIKEHFSGDKIAMLKVHQDMLKVPDLPVCEICDEMFQRKFKLKLHYKDFHFAGDVSAMYEAHPHLRSYPDPPELEPTVCEHCGKYFTQIKYLHSHLKSHDINITLKQLKEELHVQSDETEAVMNEFTDIVSQDVDKKHDSEEEKDNEIVPVKSFENGGTSMDKPNESALTPEGRRHTAMFICRVCEEIFKTKADLQAHKKSEHEESEDFEIHSAEIFEEKDKTEHKSFRNNLNNDSGSLSHITQDQKERLKCEFCFVTFAHRKSLMRHMKNKHPMPEEIVEKISADENVYETDTDISSFLGKNFNLTKKSSKSCNISTVKTKQHKCTSCGECFSRDATLKKHMLVHKSNDGDGNEDSNPDSLDNLQKAVYPCQECGNMYSTTSGILAHMKTKHEKVDMDKVKMVLNEIDGFKKLEAKPETKSDKGKDKKTLKRSAQTDLKGIEQKRIKNENESNKSFPCGFCGAIYKTYKGVIMHEKDRHQIELLSKNTLEQSMIQGVSKSGRIIKNSIKKSEMLKCPKCPKIYSVADEFNLKMHMVRVHGIQMNPSQSNNKPTAQEIKVKQNTPTKHTIKLERETNPDPDGFTVTSSKDKNEDEFKCTRCDKSFSNISNLRRHETMAHLQESDKEESPVKTEKVHYSHICEYCNREFLTLAGLKSHLKAFHSTAEVGTVKTYNKDKTKQSNDDVNLKTKLFECLKCPKQFVHQKKLETHMRKHAGAKLFICNVCKNKFSSRAKLVCHLRKMHAKNLKRKVKCKICLTLFATKAAMLRHKRVHLKKKPEHKCKVCKKVYSLRTKLDEHLKVHTDNLYKCQQCSKSFNSKQNLRSHIKVSHKDINQFTCQVCNKVFTNKLSLARHGVIHSMKKFSCKHCDKIFSMKGFLERHINIVHRFNKKHALNTVSCKICKRSFNSTEKRQKHMLSHTSVKPFKCKYCSVSYKVENNLKVHQLTHKAGEKKKQKKVESVKVLNRKNVKPEPKPNSAAMISKARLKVAKKAEVLPRKLPKMTSSSKNKNHCSECNVTFSSSSNYNRHIRKQHESMKAAVVRDIGPMYDREMEAEGNICPICKVEFNKRWILKMHMKRIHRTKLIDTQPQLMADTGQGFTKHNCCYCSDCARIFWSQVAYTTHLKHFHPDRAALDLDLQVLQQISQIKTEVIDPTFEVKTSPSKQRKYLGPVKHKCEFCSRVHWTKKSFDEHVIKHHPDKYAENPSMYGDNSQDLLDTCPPEIEVVNDTLLQMPYLSVYMDNSCHAAQREKLSSVPVVLLERLSIAFLYPYETDEEYETNEEMPMDASDIVNHSHVIDCASEDDIEEINIDLKNSEESEEEYLSNDYNCLKVADANDKEERKLEMEVSALEDNKILNSQDSENAMGSEVEYLGNDNNSLTVEDSNDKEERKLEMEVSELDNDQILNFQNFQNAKGSEVEGLGNDDNSFGEFDALKEADVKDTEENKLEMKGSELGDDKKFNSQDFENAKGNEIEDLDEGDNDDVNEFNAIKVIDVNSIEQSRFDMENTKLEELKTFKLQDKANNVDGVNTVEEEQAVGKSIQVLEKKSTEEQKLIEVTEYNIGSVLVHEKNTLNINILKAADDDNKEIETVAGEADKVEGIDIETKDTSNCTFSLVQNVIDNCENASAVENDVLLIADNNLKQTGIEGDSQNITLGIGNDQNSATFNDSTIAITETNDTRTDTIGHGECLKFNETKPETNGYELDVNATVRLSEAIVAKSDPNNDVDSDVVISADKLHVDDSSQFKFAGQLEFDNEADSDAGNEIKETVTDCALVSETNSDTIASTAATEQEYAGIKMNEVVM